MNTLAKIAAAVGDMALGVACMISSLALLCVAIALWCIQRVESLYKWIKGLIAHNESETEEDDEDGSVYG